MLEAYFHNITACEARPSKGVKIRLSVVLSPWLLRPGKTSNTANLCSELAIKSNNNLTKNLSMTLFGLLIVQTRGILCET